MVEMTQRRRGDQGDLPYTSWTDSTSVINMCLAHSFQKIKFCKTCRIYRPPRTTHCKVCDRCVSQFDHHCTLLGTCVGRNNYRAYFFFLLFGSALAISLIVFSIKILYQFNSAEIEMNLLSWSMVATIIVINLFNLSVNSIWLVRRDDSSSIFLPLLSDLDLPDHQGTYETCVCLWLKSPQKASNCEFLEHSYER